MAENFKYAQVQGTSSTGTYTNIYNTPDNTEAIVSSLVICNTSSSNITVRLGLDSASAGSLLSNEFLVYDAVVAGNDTVALTLGICMDANKYIRGSSSSSACVFSAFVSEIT